MKRAGLHRPLHARRSVKVESIERLTHLQTGTSASLSTELRVSTIRARVHAAQIRDESAVDGGAGASIEGVRRPLRAPRRAAAFGCACAAETARRARIARARGRSGVSRDSVINTLWPDTDEERARHTLNQTLYALRRELGSDEIIV